MKPNFKIKKVISFVTIITFSLGLLSCSSFRSELNARDDEKIGDTRFQEIIEGLENKDKEGLKNMFSPNALKEAKDIDGGIEYLMKFYKGKIKSKKVSRHGTDSNNHGKKTSELECTYTVTTDEDTYIVFFIDQLVDTENPNNVGLYMLQIIKKSDKEKEFDGGGEKTKCAGIYRPDTAK